MAMELQYQFNKARKIVNGFEVEDLEATREICMEIQRAEEKLQEEAEGVLNRCMNGCEGLCCRNIRLTEIITLTDFIYILAMDPSMGVKISDRLQNESLFSSDCYFLENGEGPCIFSFNSRPEKCIVTFCGDVSSIKKEINLVASGFARLSRFLLFRKVRMLRNFLFGNST
ncbi:MAG: hypothetical protein GY859_06845 [Desulfobacterales bacterium]|nr:hypothetical protein [Desulfobacterales bacterium]